MQVNKLVRDRVPDELRRLGRAFRLSTVTGEEHVRLLKEKLIEEATEAARSDGSALVEELADVLEVLIALMALRGEAVDVLVATASKKREQLGGFDDGILLLDNGLPEIR